MLFQLKCAALVRVPEDQKEVLPFRLSRLSPDRTLMMMQRLHLRCLPSSVMAFHPFSRKGHNEADIHPTSLFIHFRTIYLILLRSPLIENGNNSM